MSDIDPETLLNAMDRLAELLDADGACAGQVGTEGVKNLQTAFRKRMQAAGFGVAVTLGGGQREGETDDPLQIRQQFTVTIVRRSVSQAGTETRPAKSPTMPECVMRAIAAVDGQELDPDLDAAPDNQWAFIAYDDVEQEDKDIDSVQITFETTLNLF